MFLLSTAMEKITSKLSDLKQQQFAHDSAAWAGLGRNNFYLLQLLLAGEGHVGSSTQSGFVRRLTSHLRRVGCLEAIWLSRNLSLHSLSSSKSSLSSRVFWLHHMVTEAQRAGVEAAQFPKAQT